MECFQNKYLQEKETMQARFDQFIREGQYITNVTPATGD